MLFPLLREDQYACIERAPWLMGPPWPSGERLHPAGSPKSACSWHLVRFKGKLPAIHCEVQSDCSNYSWSNIFPHVTFRKKGADCSVFIAFRQNRLCPERWLKNELLVTIFIIAIIIAFRLGNTKYGLVMSQSTFFFLCHSLELFGV